MSQQNVSLKCPINHFTIPTFLHCYIQIFQYYYIATLLHCYIARFLHSYFPLFLHSYILTFLHFNISTTDQPCEYRAFLIFQSKGRLGRIGKSGVHQCWVFLTPNKKTFKQNKKFPLCKYFFSSFFLS